MRQILMSLCLSLIVAFLFVVPARSQESVSQENVVSGLEIKVVTKSGEAVATARSRADGSFSFTVKDVGDYYIIAEEAELSKSLVELAQQGAPVAKKAAKKASKKGAQKASLQEELPQADVDIVAAFEGNLKYDVKPVGSMLVVRKRVDKTSPILYVSRPNTPVMGKLSWGVKKAK